MPLPSAVRTPRRKGVAFTLPLAPRSQLFCPPLSSGPSPSPSQPGVSSPRPSVPIPWWASGVRPSAPCQPRSPGAPGSASLAVVAAAAPRTAAPRPAPRPRHGFCCLRGRAAPHHVPLCLGPGAAAPAPGRAARGEARPRRAALASLAPRPRDAAQACGSLPPPLPRSRRYLGGVGEAPGLRAPELAPRDPPCALPAVRLDPAGQPLPSSSAQPVLPPADASWVLFRLNVCPGPCSNRYFVVVRFAVWAAVSEAC